MPIISQKFYHTAAPSLMRLLYNINYKLTDSKGKIIFHYSDLQGISFHMPV